MDYPFTTDGCSGWLSWGWRKVRGHNPPWEDCCVEHDGSYWLGGSALDRFKADAKLAVDVAAKGHRFWALVMFVGVRFGGHPLLPLPWRWGYGWKYPKGYTEGEP